jgi:hypothetical protein
MVRAVPFILVGAVLGGVATWSVSGGVVPDSPPPWPVATPLACNSDELVRLKQRVAELEGERSHVAALISPRPNGAPATTSPEALNHEESNPTNNSLSWKISAIEKFVPLTSDQKDRLREKYERESQARANGEEVETEPLDDILGADNASYYRQQVQAAFKRVQNEEIERESVWLSRKLGLTPDQESSMREVLERVEVDIGGGHESERSGLSPQDRVRAMIAENRRRVELRNAELSKILTPEQLQAYAQIEAESSAADVEVFHDAGEGAGTTDVPGEPVS